MIRSRDGVGLFGKLRMLRLSPAGRLMPSQAMSAFMVEKDVLLIMAVVRDGKELSARGMATGPRLLHRLTEIYVII